MHDYSQYNYRLSYMDRVSEGFTLCVEAVSLGLVALGMGVIYVVGVPFYLISVLADRQINQANDKVWED